MVSFGNSDRLTPRRVTFLEEPDATRCLVGSCRRYSGLPSRGESKHVDRLASGGQRSGQPFGLSCPLLCARPPLGSGSEKAALLGAGAAFSGAEELVACRASDEFSRPGEGLPPAQGEALPDVGTGGRGGHGMRRDRPAVWPGPAHAGVRKSGRSQGGRDPPAGGEARSGGPAAASRKSAEEATCSSARRFCRSPARTSRALRKAVSGHVKTSGAAMPMRQQGA